MQKKMKEEKSLDGLHEGIRVSNLEVDSILKRIMSLSTKKIDLLWRKMGWIDSEAEKDNNKSLPKF